MRFHTYPQFRKVLQLPDLLVILSERFRRVNYGRLEIDLTIDDPKTYTRPWTVTLVQRIVLDTELLDYYCNDNEKSAGHMVGK